MDHDFSQLTQFCHRCGAPMTEVVERGARLLCQPVDSNVVGISHQVAVRRMNEFFQVKPGSGLGLIGAPT